MRVLAACFLAFLLWTGASRAAETILVRAVDENCGLLTEDGRVVRIAGLVVPAQAMADLRALVGGKRFAVAPNAAAEDRHGRTVAHLTDEQGAWLQKTLLERGLAAVRTHSDDRERAAEMLRIEAEARGARRGLWRTDRLRVREAAQMNRAPEGFAIVEGTIRQVSDRQGRLYVNFGPDWRTDFTVLAEGEARRALRRLGIGSASSSGTTVRVRGWLRFWNGPLIEVDHAEQVEIVKRP